MARSLIAAAIALAGCGEATSSDVLDATADSTSADATPNDAGPHDVTAPQDACKPPPDPTSTFVPPPYTPATSAAQGVCTSAQIADYYAQCLDYRATQATCAAYSATPANKACADCILTPETATRYGALVRGAHYVSVNIAGCMELLDPAGGRSCAAAYQAADACAHYACDDVCFDPRLQLYDACVEQAGANGCKTYTQAAACADAEADGGAAALCFRGQTFREIYDLVVPLFCGAAVLDASLD